MAQLFSNISNLNWQQAVMWLIGGILSYLAVKRDMEPALLLPMGFGAILISALVCNLILTGATDGTYFHLAFEGQPIAHTDGLWNCLGMVLVGFGCVLLGGCPLRQLVLSGEGSTPLLFSRDGAILGMMAVADTVKDDSPEAVAELRKMGIRVVMITGDNPRTAQAVGQAAGVDQVVAGVLPDGKADVVRRLQKVGRVAMVGDGINDAPALTCADVGIAIGAGTDIAMDAADVVLMNSRLSDVPAAIRLSRATLRNIHENLFWAFCYNVIGIPLAAGVFISLLGWKLNPMFGAAAMSLSSFCVVSNALRLNLFRLRAGRHDRALHPVTLPNIAAQPGAKVLTMRIDGMMCAHCEARVKAALEAVDGVQRAAASHEAGTAVVTLKADADENALKPLLKAVVEENDYEVKGFDK